MIFRLTVFLLLSAGVLRAAEIKGEVVSVAGGEALGRVQVTVLETKATTTTAGDGSFVIQNLAPGSYTLRFNAVAYRLLTVPFTLSSAEEPKEFSVTMVPDNFRRTDKVEVKGDIFQGPDSLAVSETNLTSSEIKEASTVFANDPFRAIQTLPGVSASGNNELLAEFSVTGAPFETIGVYLDGVLLPPPFHSLKCVENGASLSLLTSETVQDIKLLPVAYPEKLGDNVGAALDISTREGSRTHPLFRAAIGMADSDFLGEGSLGKSNHGSWLASARKSYLGYLVRNRVEDFSDISFYDADLKLTYDITPRHNLTFYGLGGHTNVVTSDTSTDPEFVQAGAGDFIFVRTGWRWSVTPHLLLDSHAAYIGQPSDQHNPFGVILERDDYSEWVGGSNLVWSWSKNNILEGGWTLRRLQDRRTSFFPASPGTQITSEQTILRGDTFVQQSASFLNNRIHVLGSLRWDGRQMLDENPVSPQVSVAFRLGPSTQLQAGAGQYNQFIFPDALPPTSNPSGCFLGFQNFQRANHFTLALEQRFGENTRLRLEGFERKGRSFSVISLGSNPACPVTGFPPGTTDGQHNYSRGATVTLQRRSVNRLSGWLGYTLIYARQSILLSDASGTPSFYSPYFATPEDQRHSVNGFATYRLTPTINLSAKALYGSGFPVFTGLQLGTGGGIEPAPVVRLAAYARVDFRVEKTWAFKRWKMTLYGEVLNLTDHDNRIVTNLEFVNNQFVAVSKRALPVTPTAGLAFEF